MDLIKNIKSPEDVKNFNEEQLPLLAEEIRQTLIENCANNGGHLASNLGVVELTIALHRVFNSPKDKLIWDVGHQVYTHKILTGRYEKISTIRQENGLSGFSNPEESEHDIFASGHSGTSIATAYGLSVAEKLNKDENSYNVAIIGDGSFTNGLVYEALNNAGRSSTNLIAILNDNEMSISKNVGSFARYLASFRTRPEYYQLKQYLSTHLDGFPIIGNSIYKGIFFLEKNVKNLLYRSNFFEDLGFRYMGPIDGHDIHALTEALESAKTINYPVLLHINTVKGKGYYFAEEDPGKFHGISSFDQETGCLVNQSNENFSSYFGKTLIELAEKDDKICAVTAAMTVGTCVESFEKKFPDRFYDVGIAEEFAVTFSGGLSKGGMLPVFVVYSTFLQRCYDEIVHDVAMQNQKVVLAVDRAGFVGDDGKSHQGLFDVSFLSSVPGSIIYSPSFYEEVEISLKKSLYEDGNVVAVRYPRGSQGEKPRDFVVSESSYTIYGSENSKNVIVTYGRLFSEACKAYEKLKKSGKPIKILKLNRIKPIDKEAVKKVLNADKICFFEEGIMSGGIGQQFAYMLMQQNYSKAYEINAVEDTFVSHAPIPSLIKKYKLSWKHMAEKFSG